MEMSLKLKCEVFLLKKNIAILGAGSFGTALAKLISDRNDCDITLWSAVDQEITNIIRDKENKKCLKGINIDIDSIKLTTNVEDILFADIVIFAVASNYVRKVAKQISGYIKEGAVLVNVAKGLEQGSLKRLSEVICEEIKGHFFVALSGPSHAEEIARGEPTTVVVASEDVNIAKQIQDVLNSNIFRLYVNEDLIGVELGGALKNIIALAVGICDGLNLGDNTKAALMTRGITEIGRLGVAMGAKNQTFAGLSGIGDLIVTCTSMHSRNRRAGILIGKGKSSSEALEEVGMTVEGYFATKAAYELSKRERVCMPITEQLYKVLYENGNIEVALNSLMSRPVKHESEKFWFDN